MDEKIDVVQAEIVEPKPQKQRATRVKEINVNGQVAYEYSDGSIRNSNGHMITPLPGGFVITPDNAGSLLSRRRVVGLRAQLRGLAKAEGLDPSEVDDELLMQAGSAVEALTLHMATTFKKSNSLRGMSESYGALVSPLVGDKREQQQPVDAGNGVVSLIHDIADIARASMQNND